MLTVACVNWRNYAGHGSEYVKALYNGVSRYLTGYEWRGVCLTDNPASVPDGIDPGPLPDNVSGWWNKLALFKSGTFPAGARVLYFDLDTVLVGSLDDMAGYSGRFAAMDNPEMAGLASGVMAWEAGRLNHVWDRWEYNWRPAPPRGDQQWIDFIEPQGDRLQQLYPGQLVSYKIHVKPFGIPPDGASVVYFHGRPRPHQIIHEPWMREAWRVDSCVPRTGTQPNDGAAAVIP